MPCEVSNVQLFGFSLATPTLSSMLCEVFDVDKLFGFFPTTPSIALVLSCNVFHELFWFIDAFEIYVQWAKNVENHDSIFNSFIDKHSFYSTQFHLEVDVNVLGIYSTLTSLYI
jgi:hypothetical protein